MQNIFITKIQNVANKLHSAIISYNKNEIYKNLNFILLLSDLSKSIIIILNYAQLAKIFSHKTFDDFNLEFIIENEAILLDLLKNTISYKLFIYRGNTMKIYESMVKNLFMQEYFTIYMFNYLYDYYNSIKQWLLNGDDYIAGDVLYAKKILKITDLDELQAPKIYNNTHFVFEVSADSATAAADIFTDGDTNRSAATDSATAIGELSSNEFINNLLSLLLLYNDRSALFYHYLFDVIVGIEYNMIKSMRIISNSEIVKLLANKLVSSKRYVIDPSQRESMIICAGKKMTEYVDNINKSELELI